MRKIYLLSLLLSTAVFCSMAQTNTPAVDSANKDIYEYPYYPGGAEEYVAKNLKYPHSAVKEKLNGTVILSFVVDIHGYVKNIVVEKSLSPDCDAEAKRVLTSMGKWIPGRFNGDPRLFKVKLIFKFNYEQYKKSK